MCLLCVQIAHLVGELACDVEWRLGCNSLFLCKVRLLFFVLGCHILPLFFHGLVLGLAHGYASFLLSGS